MGPTRVSRKEVDYIDVAPEQPFSIATSMIPFLEHDDANRRSWVPTCKSRRRPASSPRRRLSATGMEERAARDTGRLIYAKEAGTVVEADGKRIIS
jgi:DNA-directed RNA polymerase subunit beta